MASIRKRGKTYQVTVSNGRDSKGKQIIETATFTPDPARTEKQNQKALQLFALEFEQRVKSGKYLDGEKITFKDFVEVWKRDYAVPNLEPSTIERHEELLKGHILPAIGHLKLSKIQPAHLNRLYSLMLQERKDGKEGGYSTATIKRTHAVISGILKKAVQWNILLDNPCDRVTPPRAHDTEDDIEFFTLDQTNRFLDELEAEIREGKVKEQYRLFFLLAITCGIRRGELVAMEWSDLNYEDCTVRVTKAIGTVRGRAYDKGPKSRRSYRIISVPEDVMEVAREYQQHQASYKAAVGSYWEGENYLFISDNGKQVHPSTPYHVFKKIVRRYNKTVPEDQQLPDIPLHGLRHTNATLLISENVDIRTVSGRLGHAQTSTTLNIYAHQLQEVDRKAADTMGDLLNVRQTLGKNKKGTS